VGECGLAFSGDAGVESAEGSYNGTGLRAALRGLLDDKSSVESAGLTAMSVRETGAEAYTEARSAAIKSDKDVEAARGLDSEGLRFLAPGALLALSRFVA